MTTISLREEKYLDNKIRSMSVFLLLYLTISNTDNTLNTVSTEGG